MNGAWGTWFNRAVSGPTGASIDEIYAMTLRCHSFVEIDIKTTYRKILADVVERTHGMDSDIERNLWDSVSMGMAPQGLISLLVDGMYQKSKVFIVYNKATKVMRKADTSEQSQIEADYKPKASSEVGAYLNFEKFDLTDVLKIYSELEYYVINGLYKNVNLSKALQFKMADMRKAVGLKDASVAIDQAIGIARALGEGKNVMLDAGDSIETSTIDMGPIEKAVAFLNAKRSFYLNLPMAYISGEQTGGIGSTGEGDNRAIERGLKMYFNMIIYPSLKEVFGIETTFKTTDFREINNALETAKTFELISDTTLSRKAKNSILSLMFNLDEKEEEKAKADEAEARGSSTTLNGAQVSAMTGFLKQLSEGQLAPETAIQSLMVSFNLSRDDAEAIVQPMTNFRPRIVP